MSGGGGRRQKCARAPVQATAAEGRRTNNCASHLLLIWAALPPCLGLTPRFSIPCLLDGWETPIWDNNAGYHKHSAHLGGHCFTRASGRSSVPRYPVQTELPFCLGELPGVDHHGVRAGVTCSADCWQLSSLVAEEEEECSVLGLVVSLSWMSSYS